MSVLEGEKMEEIKSTLRIQGRNWTVKIVDPSEIEDDHGESDFRNNELRIAADADIHGNLIHELFEIINFYFELELPHSKIKTLESAWNQILMDNGLSFHE
jgi:hypothetical protein